MPNYRAPLQDMQFVITELAGLARLAALPGYEEVTPDLVAAVLGSCGAQVEIAASADQAVELIQRCAPDVLLSDIGLPSEDGYALIRRVRALPSGARLPALALTAYAGAAESRRALEAGYQRYLSKPVEPCELAALVAELAELPGSEADRETTTNGAQPPFAIVGPSVHSA